MARLDSLGPPLLHDKAGQQSKERHVKTLQDGEKEKGQPAQPHGQTAVNGEDKLDPVADPEPENEARRPAV